MKSEQLVFEETCGVCPEAYKIMYEDQEVGYLRLRWGVLNLIAGKYVSIFSATEENEVIWQHTFKDDPFKGSFDSDEEREHYQGWARTKIIEYYERL